MQLNYRLSHKTRDERFLKRETTEKESNGTTHQATAMMIWRTLRHHLNPLVNRAKINTTKCKHRSLVFEFTHKRRFNFL